MKSLESYNSGRMQRAPLNALEMPLDTTNDCAAMLSVLGSLLARREHAVVVVSERLPSTLVKTLKAVAASSASGAADALATGQQLADAAFRFLSSAIAFEDVVQELIDSSTLHRLFTLSFLSSRELQLATLAVRFCRDWCWCIRTQSEIESCCGSDAMCVTSGDFVPTAH